MRSLMATRPNLNKGFQIGGFGEQSSGSLLPHHMEQERWIEKRVRSQGSKAACLFGSWLTVDVCAAVERIWHIQDSQYQVLAVT